MLTKYEQTNLMCRNFLQVQCAPGLFCLCRLEYIRWSWSSPVYKLKEKRVHILEAFSLVKKKKKIPLKQNINPSFTSISHRLSLAPVGIFEEVKIFFFPTVSIYQTVCLSCSSSVRAVILDCLKDDSDFGPFLRLKTSEGTLDVRYEFISSALN